MMTSKQISNNAFITNLVRQAIQKVLSELVWIGNNAKNYLDLRNFWLIGE